MVGGGLVVFRRTGDCCCCRVDCAVRPGKAPDTEGVLEEVLIVLCVAAAFALLAWVAYEMGGAK